MAHNHSLADTAPQLPAQLAAYADAGNTRKSYGGAWRTFAAWCENHGARPLPASPEVVALHLAARAEDGAAVGTLRVAATAIAAAHKAVSLDVPTEAEGVRRTLRGLARRHARPVRQADALTADALSAIRATAFLPRRGRGGALERQDTSHRRGLVDVALAQVMSDAGLRRSEAAALNWSDVERRPDGSGRIHVARSKSDQEAEGAVVYITPRAMQDLDAIRAPEVDTSEPVFGLSPSQIARRIQAAARAAGLGDGFGGHSGRVGMARRMVVAGAPDSAIQRQGRWKDGRMVAAYTRRESAGSAARYLDG